jgi:HD-GYP domain-containing protein (c-di-GMP phosphodiesterase class II)
MGERLKTALGNGSVAAMLGILKLADEEAYIHSLCVAEFVEKYLCLADKDGTNEWSEEECIHILEGALLLDIGKAFLPFNLQHSAGKLKGNELEIIKMHPLLGTVAVQNCKFDKIVTDIILMHHANYNGSGYPILESGTFRGENVPDYVWLVAYADRFQAMTTMRPFKPALSYPEAWRVLVDFARQEILPYKFATLFGEIIKKESLFPIEGRESIESEYAKKED